MTTVSTTHAWPELPLAEWKDTYDTLHRWTQIIGKIKGQVAYMGSPGKGVVGAKNDLKNLLNKFDDYSFVIEAMIASESLPDLVGTYWKGSLTPKASPHDAPHINFRGVSI
jgi:hypothetical protein